VSDVPTSGSGPGHNPPGAGQPGAWTGWIPPEHAAAPQSPPGAQPPPGAQRLPGAPSPRMPDQDPYAGSGAQPWLPDAGQWTSGSAEDPIFADDRPTWQPRITPSPRQRSRLGLGLLIGLLVGLLVFGTGGYLVRMSMEPAGGATGREGTPAPSAPGPAGSASLPPYEASQLTVNRGKFDGELAAFAESWLPWLGGCAKNGEPGGPRLSRAERTRIFCEIGGLNVFFVEYTSIAEREKARLLRSQLNIDARQLTPGVVAPQERTGGSGTVSGNYVEYAFREGSGDNARAVCSVWWDDADAPVAGFLQAPWTAIGERWEPIRDVWQRYS
jgi:hypothetical protein